MLSERESSTVKAAEPMVGIPGTGLGETIAARQRRGRAAAGFGCCATMSHMERVGVRELRRSASAILRRVAAGETVEVTDRGRPVAVLLRTMPSGLARLEREGLLRQAEADLLDLSPMRIPTGATPPSRVVSGGRAD